MEPFAIPPRIIYCPDTSNLASHLCPVVVYLNVMIALLEYASTIGHRKPFRVSGPILIDFKSVESSFHISLTRIYP